MRMIVIATALAGAFASGEAAAQPNTNLTPVRLIHAAQPKSIVRTAFGTGTTDQARGLLLAALIVGATRSR